MTTYNVTAKRWKHGWELHIDGVGVTQSRSLAGAERMVRDYLALEFDADPASFIIEITPEIGDELAGDLAAARREAAEADRLARAAAYRYRKVARTLRTHRHLSGAEIATVMKVSPQRASQLLNEPKKSRA